ncbi:MAG: nucleotide sugar dehydrogenase, partial [Verrucomicrobiae bacterium]|nr:nucleotide sugar dehydrogenase [Verrucomicrobiae bacterium]
MESPHRISIVGIGKLGLSMAGALASRGFQVTGVDVRRDVVEAVNRGECPLVETGLADLICENQSRIRATTSIAKGVEASDATFIVVATPLKADQRFSNAYLEEAVKSIGQALQNKTEPHLVAVVCTVMPGTTENIVKPLLEKHAGRKCGDRLMLAYNPEFIALGTVVRDFLNPDWVLVGEDSPAAGDCLEAFYRKACKNNPPIRRMNPTNAEIAKLAQNCFVTMKISFANSLAAICEHVPNADARVVLDAISNDSRVGGKAIRPGLGFGGPCFPRDNVAFQSFATEFGMEAPLASAVQQINSTIPAHIMKRVRAHIQPPSTIAILGAAYKPNTDIVEESHAVILAQRLASAGFRVRISDRLARTRLESEAGELFDVVSGEAD